LPGLLVVVCWAALPFVQAAEYPAPIEAEAGRGWLEVVQGIPVVHLRGGPAEIGRQHGTLLAKQFAALRTGYLERFLGEPAARDAFLFAGLNLSQHIPQPYLAEMRALAKAAGEPYANVLLTNTFLDTSRAVRCSVVIVEPEGGPGEERLFARNNDFPALGIAHKASTLFVYHRGPGRAHGFVAVGWPGIIGVISGMNDAGLCLATLISLSDDGTQPGLPYPLLYRRILENCTTPQEALKMVRDSRRTSANTLAVAGPKGDSLVIEYTPKRVAARRARDGILLATNHFRSPDLVEEPHPIDGRYATLERLAAKHQGRMDVPALKTLLHAVHQDMTIQAMVFEPAARRLHLAVGSLPATTSPYRTINCAKLLAAQPPSP
jgi:hypothetical protein